jgi:O-antigen ligase
METPSRVRRQISLWHSLLAYSLAAGILFTLVSISLMEIFLGLALVFWLVAVIRGKIRASFPAFFWPLVVYSGLSLFASALSVNPAMSFANSRKLLLLLIIPVVMTAAAAPSARALASRALLASGGASAVYSIAYFIFKARPGERIMGFMGHYMTQAGVLLLFLCAALSFSLFSRDKTRWLWGAAFLLAAGSLALTYTRSAWIGFVLALALILFLYRPKALILVPIVFGVFFIVAPQPMRSRALSIFSLENYGNKLRVEYWRAGLKIVRDYPLHGTGPHTVDMVFQDPKYGLSAEARRNVHLHSDIMQIAAERGIPALLAWLAFVGWAFVSLLRLLKNRDPSVFPYAAAGTAALLAFFAAGFFEYNFGDSEVIVLLLYLVTVPFAAAATDNAAALPTPAASAAGAKAKP